MKTFKLLGLAALAALMAMALIGVGSAMAEPTGLCKADEEECSAGNRISHVHESTSSQAKLLSSVEVKCDVLYLGDVTSEGPPLAISGHFTYTNCTRENGKACEVTETSASSSLSVLKTAHELATVLYTYEVNFHCGVLINCTYDGQSLTGHSLGPLLSEKANGEVRLESQEAHRVKGFCPEIAELDILTTLLESAYLSKEEELKMVCLKVSNENTGLYNSSGNGLTCESDNKERVGNYELALVLPNLETGQMACGIVEHSGFLLSFGNGSECQTKDLERLGAYELGVVT